MNPFTVLIAAAHYGVIFPGIFICIVPVADWISIPLRKLFSVLIPVMTAICLILGCVESTGIMMQICSFSHSCPYALLYILLRSA